MRLPIYQGKLDTPHLQQDERLRQNLLPVHFSNHKYF